MVHKGLHYTFREILDEVRFSNQLLRVTEDEDEGSE